MDNFDQNEFDNLYMEMFGEYPTSDNFPCIELTPLGTGQGSLGPEIDRLVEQLQENDSKNEKLQVAENLQKNDEIVDLELIPFDDNQVITENLLEDKSQKRTFEYEKEGAESLDFAVGCQPLIETFSSNKRRKSVKTRSVETQTNTLYCYFCFRKHQNKIAVAMAVCSCLTEFPVCLRHVQTRPFTPHLLKPCSKKRIYRYEEICAESQNQRMLSDYKNANEEKENIQPDY